MKITRRQLKKIINEELELSKRITPEMGEAYLKVKAIKDVIDKSTVNGNIIHYRGSDILSQIQDILNPLDIDPEL
jgi:hypothetical protein